MKKIILLLSALFLTVILINAQEKETEEFKPSGKATGKVFWNYNYNLTENATRRNSFELKRAYFGYKYNFSKAISAKITLDGAKVSSASDYTVFVKNAQLDWKVTDMVKLSGGLIGTKQFKTQESFLSYRYVTKTIQDEFGLGSSADLGINGEIKLTDDIVANLFIFNGEGYTSEQDNNGRLKAGGNIIIEPVEGLTFMGYYDIYGGKLQVNDSVIVEDTASISTISLFAGYRTDKFRIGAEYDMQLNGTKYNAIAENQNLNAISVMGAYTINKQFEIFAQWMNLKSNTLEGASNGWNNAKDGNKIIAGLQYSPVKGVKTALNYQGFFHDADNAPTSSFLFLNFEFSF